MKYLIIISIFLSGCASMNSFTPATVEQITDARALSVKNAELMSEFADIAIPGTQVAQKIATNADTISATPQPNPYEYLLEGGLGLILTLSGVGGLGSLKKINNLKAVLKDVADMTPEDGHKHLTKVT